MRTLCLLVFLLIGQLYCTVSFQYQYNLPKYDLGDELKQILLFDINEDGTDEIVITYTNNNIYRIVVYDQLGTILEISEYIISDNYQYHKITFLWHSGNLYLVANINQKEVNANQTTRNCLFQIMDWQTGTVIDEISIFIGQYSNSGFAYYDFATSFIKHRTLNADTHLFLGITSIHHWGDMFDDGTSYSSVLYQSIFNGTSLNLMNNFSDCGTSIKFLDNSTYYSVGYHSSSSSYGVGQAWGGSKAYFVKQLSYLQGSQVDTVFTVSGHYSGDYMSGTTYHHYPTSFRVLKKDTDPWEFGYPFYCYLKDTDGDSDFFRNYEPNTNSLLWETDFSELINLGYNIQRSTTIETSQGNQFVLYFGKQNYNDIYYLEIRDLISGQYVIAEDAPFMPYAIQKNQNYETLFFVSTDFGIDVYVPNPILFSSLIPRFSCSDTLSYSPLNASFTDLSYGNLTNWAWDFNNDGIIDSNEQNPEWTYHEAGDYSVSLSVSVGNKAEKLLKEDYIHILLPEPSFTWDQSSGVVPLTINFTDNSIQNIVSWQWDFDNDGSIDSNEQNPSWTYDDIGNYSVSLTVSDGTNYASLLIEDCVEVVPFIIDFGASINIGWTPLTVTFFDLSEGQIDSWEWDFDSDGIIDSNEQNPQWTYEEPGWFDVSLTLSNSFGAETLTKSNFISAFFRHFGNVSEETFWSADSVHIMSFFDVIIEEDVTLTILPGVTVLIPMNVTFDVRGNIIAEGTENDSIFFVPYGNSYWNSIIFEQTPADADSSYFSFCHFENSKAITHIDPNLTRGGVFYLEDFSNVSISNSTFYDNFAHEGGSIYLKSSSPIIENCIFYNNEALRGAAIFSNVSVSTINNCKFLSNYSHYSGTLYFYGSQNVVINSIIANNYSLYDGGGVYCKYLSPSFINCVFWSNKARQNFGYGNAIYMENASPFIKNSIFYYPAYYPSYYQNQIYLADDNCLPEFEYCNILLEQASLGGPGVPFYPDSLFQNIIDVEPLFTDPTNVVGLDDNVLVADWMLTTSSACIDAGNPDPIYHDPEDPNNPGMALYPSFGTIINDMGAYGGPEASDWYFTKIENHEIQIPFNTNIMTNYPNPFNPSTKIVFSSEFINKDILIEIFNSKGQLVRTIKPDFNSNFVFWDGKDLYKKHVSSGIYFYKLMVNGESIATRKCLLIK